MRSFGAIAAQQNPPPQASVTTSAEHPSVPPISGFNHYEKLPYCYRPSSWPFYHCTSRSPHGSCRGHSRRLCQCHHTYFQPNFPWQRSP
ncbi:hypothetical protein [Rubritalea tangerina]|uniref:hypothetical protein n=1 Tax=Rubritalea tangerina TaxID=430798 RepID=UPI003608C944